MSTRTALPDLPRRAGAAVQRLRARTPLRVQLVATMLVLVIAGLVGSGFAARATMRSYLVGRVDSQLRSVAEHSAGDHHDDHDHQGGPGGQDTRQDLPSAFVVETTDADGKVVGGPTSSLIDSAQPLPDLPHPSAATTSRLGTQLFTVPARTGEAQWRVLAEPTTLSDGTRGTLLVAQSLGDVQNTLDRLTLLLLVIDAVAVIFVAGAGYLIVRASFRPLGKVERTAAAIAAGDLSHRLPEADPRTEVGRLSGALNAMLTDIETAFAARAASEEAARRSEDRMRRFVADASHELRTPLTSIRGFAEFFRKGAASEPADTARLMRRIEDEAKRMGMLVEDLLLLARLDQERPLARLPVDMLAVVGDAVHDAHAVDPARPITLSVGHIEPPPVVVGDESRLRQVVGNLVANALRHTPAGTAVEVTLETAVAEPGTHGFVRIVVADQGPGMSADAATRVFERFYRGDIARSGGQGSTGLGLAIVAALVAGHGGTVAVDTAPGLGARFVVELPLAGLEC